MKSLLVVVALAASAARADTIAFTPPNPSPHASVDAIVSGTWPNGCGPRVIDSSVTGSTITLRLNGDGLPNVSCLAALFPYAQTFHLGLLPGGKYAVVATVTAGDSTRELAQAVLIVRDSDSFRINPYAVPVTGRTIVVSNPFAPLPGTVKIDGADVRLRGVTESAFTVDAPPHAAGAVDVTVTSEAGSRTARAGLIYFDPARPDPAAFEPILFPVALEGAGAFGAKWLTENLVLSPFDGFVTGRFSEPLPCAGCTSELTASSLVLENHNQPWGQLLYATRGTLENVTFFSRVRDLSLQAESAGVGVPVVRERDFRAGLLRFPGVPLDARYRVMLRVWTMEDDQLLVTVMVPSGFPLLLLLETTRIPGAAMSFASIDVTAALRKVTGTAATSVMINHAGGGTPQPPLWAMLSITNNETQQVTIISPR
jgi:hypothetical protein